MPAEAYTPVVIALERMTVLDRHVGVMRECGYIPTAQPDPFTVDIRELRHPPAPPRHLRHLVLSLGTFGMWALLWLIVGRAHARGRRRIAVAPFLDGTWRIHVAESGQIETYELW